MASLKICVVGPPKAGKTHACRLLGDTLAPTAYEPTAGVRVQEVERFVNGEKVGVALWDCAGDFAYQACFPAITAGIHGLVVCYNPDSVDEAELEKWVQAFAGSAGLVNTQCLVLALKQTPGPPRQDGLTGKLRRIQHATIAMLGQDVSPDDVVRLLGAELDRLVSSILMMRNEANEKRLLGQ